MYDIIIIGAGTAGLTSAIYASRSDKKVLVLEALSIGGQIVNTNKIDNYPGLFHISGYDYSMKLKEQALDLGTEIKFEKAIDLIKNDDNIEVMTEKNKYKCKSCILALGVVSRKLNLPNEKELTGKGISYCATCDGMFYKGKEVAVNGGGNTALDDALFLSGIAKKVYLIHRRDEFRGNIKTVEELKKKDNVEFILNSTVTKLNGKDKLESIEVTDKEENKKILNVDALFIAIGQIPENNNILDIIDKDEKGYIIAKDNDMHTNIPHIYVAGDIREKRLRQLVTAASDGAVAAVTAIRELNR